MNRFFRISTFGLILGLIILTQAVQAQTQQLYTSQQFRLGDRVIRIAEPGELVDSVNVWGDVGSAGRYLIPKGTDLTKLLSYSFGPRTLSDGQTQIDWSKMRVEVNVQEYDAENGGQLLQDLSIDLKKRSRGAERVVLHTIRQCCTVKRKLFRDH